MSALSWRSLGVRYGSRLALDAGPLALEGGQMVALLGPNGSGKSSLLKALAGAVGYQAEGLRLDGASWDALGRAERARRIAYLSQTRTGPALVSVADVVALGRFAHRGADPDGRVAKVMDRLDLASFAARRFGHLSGGEQARALLARALAVGAPLLLADEPTAALDPYFALSLLGELRAEAMAGALVIVSLHDLALAERFCDSAVLLDGGRIAAQGPVDEVLSVERLADTFRLERTGNGFVPRA